MKDSIFKKALSVLLILFSIYCAYVFRGLIGYILISVGLSFAGRPIVELVSTIKIKGKKLPKAFGALVALTTFLITGALLLVTLGSTIVNQAEALLANIDTQSLAGNLKGWVSELDGIIEHLDVGNSSLSSLLITETSEFVEFISVSNLFSDLFSVIGSTFIAVFSILFMTFFFLKDSNLFYKIIIALTPDSQVEHIKNIMVSSAKLLTRYFSGLIVQVAIVTIMVSSGLALIGVKNALILGVIAGILNLIPYIGPLFGTGLGLLIVVTTFEGGSSGLLPEVGLVALVYLVTQLVDNFITQPVLFSNTVKAHPLEIFIVISMASLGGVTGMILAVPGYTLLRIIANEFLSGHKVVDALTQNIEEK